MRLRLERRPVAIAALAAIAATAAAAADEQQERNVFQDALDAALIAKSREASGEQMKKIFVGMHKYHDAIRRFPAAFTAKDGQPLLSWRVAILRYLDDPQAAELYKQFHLDEPWDSPHNKPLLEKMPAVFRSPASALADGRTVYLTPRADFTVFPGEQQVPLRAIIDGASKTIALVEVDDEHAVPWTKPHDWKVGPDKPKATFTGQYDQGANTAFVDGSVHFISYQVDDGLLKALLTMAGREPIQLPR